MVATVEAMAIENDIKKVPKEILPTSFKFILIHFNVSFFNISEIDTLSFSEYLFICTLPYNKQLYL